MNVCTKCGAQYEDGVQFCQNCGMKRGNPVVKKQKVLTNIESYNFELIKSRE
ncbi:hypothetical protein SZ39_0127 [Bacillus mycoides]|nr:hypothetical protein SZ39_0127 [Bacillus mycoides]